VYVSNLPANLDKYGLRGIFSRAGKIVNAYIPVGWRKGTQQRFGFIRYASNHEAERSLWMFNRRTIRGHRISVSMARKDFPRRRSFQYVKETSRRMGVHQQKVWKEKIRGMQRSIAPKSQKHQDKKELIPKSIKGIANMEFLPWLSRSLVCTTQEPRDPATLASAVISGYGQCTRISALSGYQFILTFQSVEERDTALENHEELDGWFTEIKAWDRYDWCTTRKAWLEVVGVPPHGWIWENFQQIAGIWGYLISLSKPIIRTDAFDSMKLLIETDIMSCIEEHVILNIEDLGYRIYVKEVNTTGLGTQASQPCKPHHVTEDVQSNYEVPGFEDVITPQAVQSNDVVHGRSYSPSANQEHEGRKHSGEEENNSKFEQGDEGPNMEYQHGGNVSFTRTKIAQLSNNEYSEEVLMMANQLEPEQLRQQEKPKMSVQQINEESSIQEPPGFERKNLDLRENATVKRRLITADSQPNMVQGTRSEQSKEAAHDNSGEGRKSVQLRQEIITVDQGKQANRSSISPKARSTTNSSDSCEKLAQEALRIGQALGIKVVSHEKAVVERLKESIRKKKRVQAISSKTNQPLPNSKQH